MSHSQSAAVTGDYAEMKTTKNSFSQEHGNTCVLLLAGYRVSTYVSRCRFVERDYVTPLMR